MLERRLKGNSLLIFPQSFVSLDIETTGLDPCYDEIIEIAGIKYENGVAVDSYESLVKPMALVNDFITELTGISNEMLANSPSIDAILPDFMKFIGNYIIVGHNVNFDINFLYDNASRLNLPPLSNDYVDTVRISRRLYPDLPNHKLSTLVSHLCVGDDVKHRALSDCSQAAQCLAKMKNKAEQIGGLNDSQQFWSKLRAKDVKAECNDFDIDSPMYGKTFVFTGQLEKMDRRTAMQLVVNAGGQCGDNVTKKTNYLVLGNNDYCPLIKNGKSNKQKKAEQLKLTGLDISVISENVFYDMIGK